MSTTSDRLALLQRTKAGQRALLEEMYPDLDFSTVPFREYGRLFTGRKYVPGFVGGWKTYGRSNAEDPATRDILPDYSGNGRDIRLYNFAFSGMSGYGGYAQESYSFTANLHDIYSVQSVGPKVIVNKIDGSSIPAQGKFIYKNISTGWNLGVVNKIKAGDYGIVIWKTKSRGVEEEILCELAPGDTGTFVNEQTDIDAGLIYIMAGPQIAVPAGQSFSFEFLPTYPGALVSDGIDDYGQCIKGFSLPDDYTVVAIRRIIEGHDGGFVSKGSTGGAFIFDSTRENIYAACWSYGVKSTGTPMPDLFSYQSKASYNGQEISYGTAEDTAEDQLTVFRHGTQLYCKGVLYDQRIYDHTLTAEELQIVKDEMMTDYEKATGGGIADIHYVADWDGKDRSNDEDEPMRSTWTDRATGKVIDLHNYAYAGMSGWGGYGQDFSAWVIINSTPYQGDLITVNANTMRIKGTFSEGYNRSGLRLDYTPLNNEEKFFLKVLGLKDGQLLYIIDETPDVGKSYIIDSDGIADIRFTTASSTSKPNPKLFIYVQISEGSEAVDVTIEQLPLYPGALVSDGVDDYGVTQEAINEEVGTMLTMLKANDVKAGSYFFNCGKNENVNRLYCWLPSDGIPKVGLPSKNIIFPLAVLTRTPASPSDTMYIASYSGSSLSKIALYRLILIREQLDGAQVEFLKWKVEKEYREWCKANGYEYAINQLTA